ncbi:LysR family transcriptional regulator [Ferrimonas aestuarii]|uniref:LysR family transcriptional regulator n=1 Tax=Ferrimonas aestuarii TaxID=2569539 RepID=A0A4U1BLU9_9GAMM|nr:LysR family transcriptional regulator [Ferrimonas aestuarii]TKB54278.1 LysR family transcriptional regulator [Ferrimonas aestuarii]
MSRVPYNQLDIFIAIANQGSIRGAARQLQITSPSVSQALKQLEQQLGLPLFIRTTRSIELTDAGRELLEATHPAMQQLNLAMDSVKSMGVEPSGKLRITLPKFVFQIFLQPLYAEFCRRYPKIDLDVSLDDQSVDLIKDGYDLGIRFGDRISDTMVAKRLTPDIPVAIFASPEYLAHHPKPKVPDELKCHKQIKYRFLGSRKFAPMLVEKEGKSVEIDMDSAIIVNDTDMITDAAIQGLGVAIGALPSVKHHLESGRLQPLLQEHWVSLAGLHLYYVQGSQKAKRVRALIDFLTEHSVKAW